MHRARVLTELLSFLRQEKKYWLMPVALVLVLFGALIVFSHTSALAPFIYSLF